MSAVACVPTAAPSPTPAAPGSDAAPDDAGFASELQQAQAAPAEAQAPPPAAPPEKTAEPADTADDAPSQAADASLVEAIVAMLPPPPATAAATPVSTAAEPDDAGDCLASAKTAPLLNPLPARATPAGVASLPAEAQAFALAPSLIDAAAAGASPLAQAAQKFEQAVANWSAAATDPHSAAAIAREATSALPPFADPSAPAPRAGAETRPSIPVALPPQHPRWPTEIAEHVSWTARQGITQAELKLHPEELGSVDVRLSLDGDRASIWFVAPHAAAREALQAALPVLQARFAQDGLTLTQAQVSDQSPRGQRQAVFSLSGSSSAQDAPAVSQAVVRAPRAAGLIDDYA